MRWALLTPAQRRGGAVPIIAGITQPTAVYEALVQGLAAAQLAGAAAAALEIVSNYELIIKQGRGEWRVRNPEQRALAERATDLRQGFCAVRFSFAPTAEVLALVERVTG